MSLQQRLLSLPIELIINVLSNLTISELYKLNYMLENRLEHIIKLMPNAMFVRLFQKTYSESIYSIKTLNINYAVLLNENNEEILNWIDTIENKPTNHTDNIKLKMYLGAKYGFIDVYNKYNTFLDATNYLEGVLLFNLATKGDNRQIIIDSYYKIKFYDNGEEYGPFFTIIEKGIKNLINNNSFVNIGILVNLLFGDGYEGFMFTAMSYALKHNKIEVVSHLITEYYFDNEPGLSFDIGIVLSDISKLMDVSESLNEFLIEMNNFEIPIYQEDLEDCFVNALIYGRFNTMMVLINYGANINDKCICAAIIGGNLECIDYLINNYEVSDNLIKRLLLASSSVGTKEIIQYLIQRFPHIINNIIINEMFTFALAYANKECCIYIKELGEIKYNKMLESSVNIINRRQRINERIDLEYDFSDFSIKLYKFEDDFNSKYAECKQLVESWIN